MKTLWNLRALESDTVSFVNQAQAVFELSIQGWNNQQRSRGIAVDTVKQRESIIKQFQKYTDRYPWDWTPEDLQEWTSVMLSGEHPFAHSTIRSKHGAIALYCDYLIDPRYRWANEFEERFGGYPSQICYEWNTTRHLAEFEGRPGRRGFTEAELFRLLDVADQRVDDISRTGAKGSVAALRDAHMLRIAFGFGLRRRELVQLDLSDLRVFPGMPEWGSGGSLQVRFGKASRGGPPRRRLVLLVPQLASMVVPNLRQWVQEGRDKFGASETSALWLTERRTRISNRTADHSFSQIRDLAGLPKELTLHSFRHTYISLLTTLQYPRKFISDQVGHSFASSTEIYTDVGAEFGRKLVQAALKDYR